MSLHHQRGSIERRNRHRRPSSEKSGHRVQIESKIRLLCPREGWFAQTKHAHCGPRRQSADPCQRPSARCERQPEEMQLRRSSIGETALENRVLQYNAPTRLRVCPPICARALTNLDRLTRCPIRQLVHRGHQRLARPSSCCRCALNENAETDESLSGGVPRRTFRFHLYLPPLRTKHHRSNCPNWRNAMMAPLRGDGRLRHHAHCSSRQRSL